MPRILKPITVQEIQYLAHSLAKEILAWNEPIPDFETRYPNILESCVAAPFQTYARKLLYPGLERKASVLFYGLIKNHPFQNGNKRIAVTALLVFLYINKAWLKTTTENLYRFAVWIAESPSEVHEETTRAIEKFIKRNLKRS